MEKKKRMIVKRRAYVACDGGSRNHTCWYGCTACGSCIEACPKHAISFNGNGVAAVDSGQCVGCRLCEKACPQGIVHMRRLEDAFFVRCSNQDKGAEASKACDVSCIACGLCTRNCPSEAIMVEDGCAWIDQDACLSCGNCVVKCPRKAVYDIRGFIKR